MRTAKEKGSTRGGESAIKLVFHFSRILPKRTVIKAAFHFRVFHTHMYARKTLDRCEH